LDRWALRDATSNFIIFFVCLTTSTSTPTNSLHFYRAFRTDGTMWVFAAAVYIRVKKQRLSNFFALHLPLYIFSSSRFLVWFFSKRGTVMAGHYILVAKIFNIQFWALIHRCSFVVCLKEINFAWGMFCTGLILYVYEIGVYFDCFLLTFAAAAASSVSAIV